MSLEREIKEAFERHADDATPAPDAWGRTETKIVRARRARTASVSVVALAAVAAVAIAIPRLTHDTSARFDAPGSSDPPSTEPTTSPSPVFAFSNTSYAYMIFFDHDWQQSAFEGHDEYRPRDLPSFETGQPTFGVDVTLEVGTVAAAIPLPDGHETIAGRDAAYQESQAYGHSMHFAIDWTGRGGCPGGAPDCASSSGSGPKVLQVRVTGSTQEMWINYASEGLRSARSIQEVQASAPASSPHDASAARQVVLKFIDARALGRGAEQFLTTDAKHQYDTHEGGLGLYQETATGVGKPYRGGEVIRQVEADANSWEFTIQLQYEAGGVTESIGVGPGTTYDGRQDPYVIRFAMIPPDARPTPAPKES